MTTAVAETGCLDLEQEDEGAGVSSQGRWVTFDRQPTAAAEAQWSLWVIVREKKKRKPLGLQVERPAQKLYPTMVECHIPSARLHWFLVGFVSGFSAVLSAKISLAECYFWHSAGVFVDCQGWLVVKIAFRVAVAWVSPELHSLHLQYWDFGLDFPATIPGIKWFCNRSTLNAAISSSVLRLLSGFHFIFC